MNMRVRRACLQRLAGLLLMCCAVCASAAEIDRPNIVVILADDLGSGDLGCFGATTIHTPRLDRMAAEGVRFTDFYSAAPFCSPSRAALLTGRLPARCGLPYVLFPTENHGLPQEELTLAELLREQGYATACIGKWHLGWSPAFRPGRQGFDEFFGLPYSNDGVEWGIGEPFIQTHGVEPLPLVDGDRVVEAPVDQSTLTRRYTERAIEFIRTHRERPFFLYLAHTMPHTPQYASMEFEGKSAGGLYGDVVEELDHFTGRLLDSLEELSLSERTLVVFTSDNGAAPKPPQPAQGAAAGRSDAKPGRFAGRAFGGSNGPLRAGKGTTFEGGVRVPGIAWWPGTIAAGRTVETPVSTLDLVPTAVALAGRVLPGDRTFDGVDLSGLLLRGEPLPQRVLYHYFGLQLQAVRDGRWKLFVEVDQLPTPRPASLWWDHQPALFEKQHRPLARPELYGLASDTGEKTNVATGHPEEIQRLSSVAREFDAALQADRRPMQFAPGPTPPEPGRVRNVDDDLSRWRQRK